MSQRLAPLSVGYRAMETAARLGWILIFVTFGSSQVLEAWQTGLLVVGGLLAAGLYQVVYWQRFEYELTADTFDIRSGVFSRRTREIPLRRVQNVDLQRNVVQRALGLTEVRLETAGGSDTEAQLRFVTETEAEQLRAEISRLKRGAAETPAGEPATEPEAELLFAVTPRELFVLGIVSVDLRLLSLVTVVLPILVPSVGAGMGPVQDPLVAFALSAPMAAAVIIVVAALISGLYSVTNYWGFELRRAEDELRYDRGLFQRFSGTIPLAKVQALSLTENALARRLGYASLSVETAGYGPGDASGSQSAVPIAERDRVVSLARSVEPFGPVEFERPPKRARLRYVVRYTVVALFVVAAAYAANRFTGFTFAWYVAFALLPLAPVGAHLKWRNLGYALLEDHFVARGGFWSRETRIVPYYRVQTVIESATVFQRRRDLATLVVDTAGSGGLTGSDARALDIDADRAAELRDVVEERLQRALDDARAERRRRRLVELQRTETGGFGGDVSPTDD
ncbi:PH domain-containing protein [Salinirubellus salinus]|uniref:PH domain-containing protein n=1 Tax=Salinirubellus salinus TaxID=1364945 RepID=A0A9E7U9F4_9EURY|nr:PH domain-containing protein [Salinirubellus salinus]UWM55891.1 PH domain-containing protein [Salinirubellus salinus]